MRKIKVDSSLILTLCSGVLGLAGILISNKKDSIELSKTKAELKTEILSEIAKGK